MLSTPKLAVCLESPLMRKFPHMIDSKGIWFSRGNHYLFSRMTEYKHSLWSNKDVQVYEPKTISGECIEDASSIGIRLPGGVHLSYLDKSRAIR